MKKVLIVLFISACTVQENSVSNCLLVADRPTTASKETLRLVFDNLFYKVSAPSQFIVVVVNDWREMLSLYYQLKVGTFWIKVASFPMEGGYPKIQKVEQPKSDSLVVWLILTKDLTVTRSYLLQNSAWTPR